MGKASHIWIKKRLSESGQAQFLWGLCVGSPLTGLGHTLPSPPGGSVYAWSPGPWAPGSTSISTNQFTGGIGRPFSQSQLIISHPCEGLGRDFRHALSPPGGWSSNPFPLRVPEAFLATGRAKAVLWCPSISFCFHMRTSNLVYRGISKTTHAPPDQSEDMCTFAHINILNSDFLHSLTNSWHIKYH